MFILVGCGGLERKKKYREDCIIGKVNIIIIIKLNIKYLYFFFKI